jgi:uncharacterized protein
VKRILAAVATTTLLALGGAAAAAAVDVPFLSGRVVDDADLLPPDAEQRIAARLDKLEGDTGTQVVLLTVPTLDGNPIEDYALKVAETWKLGRQGVDDGVLFLIARDDRALRLEVGYGLESKLPDITCKRIIDELVVPRFRDGDFAGGVEAGIAAVEKGVRGGDPLPPPRRRGIAGVDGTSLGRVVLGFVALAFLFPFAMSALYTTGPGSWLGYGILTLFLAVFSVATFGVIGLAAPLLWLIGFPLLRRRIQRALVRGAGRRRPAPVSRRATRHSGGWWGTGGGWGGYGGGFGGGGFGGGGGGGFSGGGGSFGGGGASGRW